MYLSILKFLVIINSTFGGFIQYPSLRLYKRHHQLSLNLFNNNNNNNNNKSFIYKISFNNQEPDEDYLTKFRIYTGLNIILFLYYFYLNNNNLMNY